MALFENKYISYISIIAFVVMTCYFALILPEHISQGRTVLLFELENIIGATTTRALMRLAGLQLGVLLLVLNLTLLAIDRIMTKVKKYSKVIKNKK